MDHDSPHKLHRGHKDFSNPISADCIHILLPVTQFASAIFIIAFIIIYIKAMRTMESRRSLCYLTLALFSTQVIYLIIHAIRDIYFHSTHPLHKMIQFAALCLFALQYDILLFLSLYRLHISFKQSIDRLSSRTIGIFYSILAFYVVIELATITFLVPVQFKHLKAETLIIEFSNFIFALFFMCMPTYLFVYKLVKYMRTKHAAGDYPVDMDLIAVVTKLTLLSSVAIASLIILFVIVFTASELVFLEILHEDYFELCLGFCLILDTWINFISVFLAFVRFKNTYKKLCGCCDRRLQRRFKDIVTTMSHENVIEMVIRSGNPSETTRKDTCCTACTAETPVP